MKHGFIENLHPVVLLALAAVSLFLAAVSSGLTQGIFTLSTLELEVLAASSSGEESDYARKILPLRKKSNLVLTTLLVTSTVAQELLPLTIYPLIPHGIYPLVISVGGMFLFGNIIPEALCLRHGLKIASYFSSFVKALVFICFPISFPLSKAMDAVIGRDYLRVLNRRELKTLFDLYERYKYNVLTSDEYHIVESALALKDKKVKDIMTPAEHVFMLDVDQKLDRKLTREIAKNGHSRIPLYDGNRNNVVALLLVKGLISYNPSEKLPIRVFVSKHAEDQLAVTAPLYVSDQTNVETLLGEFQRGHSHMAIVYDKPHDRHRKFLGVVTLEDIIEEILQEEIIDETDQYQDMTSMKPVSRLIVKGLRQKLQNRSSSFLKQSRLRGEGYIAIKETDLKTLLRGADMDYPRRDDEDAFKMTSPLSERREKAKKSMYHCEGAASLPNVYEAWKGSETVAKDKSWQDNDSTELRNKILDRKSTSDKLSQLYASSAPEEYSWSGKNISAKSSLHRPVNDVLAGIDRPSDDMIISQSLCLPSIWNTDLPFTQSEMTPLLATSAPENSSELHMEAIPDTSSSSSSTVSKEVGEPLAPESRTSFDSIPRSRQLVLNSFLRWKKNKR
ncbi:Metal transporter CNNM2 [Galdieria sulphuraria]|nr:Metal transporter CNNM2 [Galdieria sulphuraria]